MVIFVLLCNGYKSKRNKRIWLKHTWKGDSVDKVLVAQLLSTWVQIPRTCIKLDKVMGICYPSPRRARGRMEIKGFQVLQGQFCMCSYEQKTLFSTKVEDDFHTCSLIQGFHNYKHKIRNMHTHMYKHTQVYICNSWGYTGCLNEGLFQGNSW